MDETAVARTTGVAQVFDLHAVKAFAPDRRVRKRLFKTDQLWSEIACYEPGPSSVMHHHPKEEEAIFVLQGTANMNIAGEEVVVPSGSIVKFPATFERMEDAGSGGTAELLAWMLVLAFTAGPADVLAYMPTVAWRTGTGMVVWPEIAK